MAIVGWKCRDGESDEKGEGEDGSEGYHCEMSGAIFGVIWVI